jgi:flagellar hook-associated protein 3 FlgL
MDQISTSAAYGSVLSSLMAGEQTQFQISQQISSGQQASDLKGYGGNAETLTAMQAANTQVGGYISQTQAVGAQLSLQDSALQEVAGAGTGAREAIANVLAAGDGSTLMGSLQTYLQTAVSGLNSTYNGQYLFSGGQSNTAPVNVSTMAGLAAAPSIASVFQNGPLQTTSQIDPNTNIPTGFQASQVATPLFTALQNIAAYAQANGPFTGPLTAAQSSFLQSQLSTFDTVNQGLTDVVAQNGQMQSQVAAAQTNLTSQQTMLTGLIGDVTNADLAKATVNLQQAQLSIQASEQVLTTLKSSSLLNLLSPTGVA